MRRWLAWQAHRAAGWLYTRTALWLAWEQWEPRDRRDTCGSCGHPLAGHVLGYGCGAGGGVCKCPVGQ